MNQLQANKLTAAWRKLQRLGYIDSRREIPSRVLRVAPTAGRRSVLSAVERDAPVISRVAASSPSVFVTGAAQEAFRLADLDHLETGGGLYGRVAGDVIRIEGISSSAYLRRRNSTRLDLDDIEQMEQHFAGVDWVRVGCWHTHPTAEDATPSRTDLYAWAVGAEQARRSYLGLILTPRDADSQHGPDWSKPGFSAWLLNPGGSVATALCRISLGEAFQT
jgi:hypothetical protein